MNNANSEEKVLVQVVPLGGRREITWGSSTAEALRNRLEDIRLAIAEGCAGYLWYPSARIGL